MKPKIQSKKTNTWVVISDLHAGCQFGLCPKRVKLDGGGVYVASDMQRKLLKHWESFWEWADMVARGERYGVILNGDAIDGRHHNSITQISHNLADQVKIARELLEPVVDGRPFILLRGTEAHGGPSGESEEELAQQLNALPDAGGNRSRNELWLKVGKGLVHCLHTIGSSSAAGFESSAIHRELVEAYADSARWRRQKPDLLVRSHRHRYIRTSIPTANGEGIAVITPAWQLKTPFAYKIASARQLTPQIGGIVIKQGDEDLYERSFVVSMDRPRTEQY